MTKPVATVASEASWDALQDGLELVLRLFSTPRTTAELVAATHEPANEVERKLARLAKAGLVQKEDERWAVVARHLHQVRQEGMVTFLTRYVLPSMVRAAREEEGGWWTQVDLDLTPEEQASLRSSVWSQVQELNELSLQEADDQVACTAVWTGTSDVPRTTDAAEKMVETVRRAARQRVTPGSADRAVLWQFDGLFGRAELPNAERVMKQALEQLREKEPPAGRKATYTLLLGFFVRGRSRASGGNDEA